MKVTLKKQIAALQEEIGCVIRSHTHRIGKHKNTIPPGRELNHLHALKAAKRNLLRNLEL